MSNMEVGQTIELASHKLIVEKPQIMRKEKNVLRYVSAAALIDLIEFRLAH